MEQVWIGNKTYDAAKEQYEKSNSGNGGIDSFIETLVQRGINQVQEQNRRSEWRKAQWNG